MTGKDMNGDQKGHKSTKIPMSSQLVTGNYSQGGKFTAEDISLFHILSSLFRGVIQSGTRGRC